MEESSLKQPKTRFPVSINAVIVSIALMAVIIMATLWLTSARIATFSADGITFKYPSAYSDQTFLADKSIIASLKADKPVGNITLALEKGADTGANLAKMNVLDNLESSLAKNLPSRYKGYKKDSQTRIKQQGHDAARHVFSYTGTDGNTKIYAVLVIIPLNHDAYYLTVESTDKKHADDDTDLVLSSLKI